MKRGELPERILREKSQRKTSLTHPQSIHSESSNSSTLTLSILTSLRGSLPKPFLTIPTSMRRPFGIWEAVRKGPISYQLTLWSVAKSGKLKKKQVRRQSRSLEGLNTLGRLDLEGLLLFMYPNFILQWIIDRLEGSEEVFR